MGQVEDALDNEDQREPQGEQRVNAADDDTVQQLLSKHSAALPEARPGCQSGPVAIDVAHCAPPNGGRVCPTHIKPISI